MQARRARPTMRAILRPSFSVSFKVWSLFAEDHWLFRVPRSGSAPKDSIPTAQRPGSSEPSGARHVHPKVEELVPFQIRTRLIHHSNRGPPLGKANRATG